MPPSTYLGGSGQDQIPAGVAIDGSGNAYIAGFTASTDFPTANPLQPTFAGGLRDGWVAKISELTRPYTITDRGGVSFSGHGTSALTTGYVRIQPNTSSMTPPAVAILGFRQNNVLINEAAMPATAPVTSGRIYAEVSDQVKTGIAIANGNNQAVTANFFFTNEAGQNSAQGSISIPANGQIARFLNEPPFNAESSFRGTWTFNAGAPVGVMALRGFTNERSEFLITMLPVVDLSSAASETAVIPDFADGGGWTTTIVLVNSTDSSENGSIQFLGQGSANVTAEPVNVTVGTQQSSTFTYAVPPRASFRLQTRGSTAVARVGSVRVTPALFFNAPSAFAISSFRNAGTTVSEVSAQAVRAGSAFRMYAEASGNFGQYGSIQTGIAIANTASTSVPVTFELTSLTGASTGLQGSVTVPPQGQVALFLSQIPGFQSLPRPFQGILRISTNSAPGISIMGIRGRYNERGDFLITAVPPMSEAATASSAEIVFPQWAIGGGYSTQFVLSGLPGQTSAGELRFFSPTGQPLM
ncbi:MAG: hypothetical protein DMG14_32415 [Acidobacteria bacterium]|nr:MAG: hypothetical protein DMG14_32415 [Acidobacteriota bacterium]